MPSSAACFSAKSCVCLWIAECHSSRPHIADLLYVIRVCDAVTNTLQVAHPARQAFSADRLETPALHSMSARRQALPFSLGRAGPAAGRIAPPAAPTSGFPRPATITMNPTANPSVTAKAATAPPSPAATAAVNSVAMIPEEDEDDLFSSSSSSPTGKDASFAQASSSTLGPELDEDSARLVEFYRSLGPLQSDSDSDSE